MAREPVVVAEGIQRVLSQVIQPNDPDSGEAVQLLAERANTSPRTIYRCLAGNNPTIKLDLADRICLAVGRQLAEIGCEVVLPDGRRVPYEDA